MTALQRIAEFSARVRGHQPSGWWTLEGSATSRCATCERSIAVYRSLAQPEMDGAALAVECEEPVNSKPARSGGQDTERGPYLFPEGRKDLANHQSSHTL